jgi:hypothetical protein
VLSGAPAAGRKAHRGSGSESGMWRPVAGSSWRRSLAPPPPRLAKRASLASCSAVSSLLRPTPTPRHRPSTSSALRPSRRAACRHHDAQDSGVSQFRYTKRLHMQRVYDHVGYPRGLPWRPLGCCLPLRLTASAAGSSVFRGSIPRLWFPLSTLRNGPHGPSRMTRGQHDWLGLCCATLSFAT